MSPDPKEVLRDLELQKQVAEIAEIQDIQLYITKIKYELDNFSKLLEKRKRKLEE